MEKGRIMPMMKRVSAVMFALGLMHHTGIAAPSDAPPAGIKAIQRGDGAIFTDSAGMALYIQRKREGKVAENAKILIINTGCGILSEQAA